MHAYDFQRYGPFSIQLLEKHTLNPEITIMCQFHAQKALFKVPKICIIDFWIENDPPPFGTFPKIHPIWLPDPSQNDDSENSKRRKLENLS